jgi:endo-1,4-beta-xylanase
MGKFLVLLILVFSLLAACSAPKSKEAPRLNSVPSFGDEKLTGGITYTSNSNGNRPLPDSPYGYEMWTEGGNNNSLTWYGADQGGGAAFRAEWNKPNDFLGRVGLFWNQGKSYASYGNLYCDFKFTRSGKNTAGDYSYIGIYGWSRNPLVEYYIIEDWFGNQWQSDTTPITTNTTGGVVQGIFAVDGSDYRIIKNTRYGRPSIDGTATFDQYFSIRQNPRQSGTISITKHFNKWKELGMNLGSNMYEAKFLVEAAGGDGWFDASYLSFRSE